MFKNPFSFNGRIRRSEYGLTYILYLIASFIVTTLMESGGDATQSTALLFIPVIWIFLAQGSKRCHDRGNSGWHQIIPFYFFVLLFGDSDEGENEFGLNPKGIGNPNENEDIGKHLID